MVKFKLTKGYDKTTLLVTMIDEEADIEYEKDLPMNNTDGAIYEYMNMLFASFVAIIVIFIINVELKSFIIFMIVAVLYICLLIFIGIQSSRTGYFSLENRYSRLKKRMLRKLPGMIAKKQEIKESVKAMEEFMDRHCEKQRNQ